MKTGIYLWALFAFGFGAGVLVHRPGSGMGTALLFGILAGLGILAVEKLACGSGK